MKTSARRAFVRAHLRTVLALVVALAGAASIDVIVRAQGGPGQNINVVTGSGDQFTGDLFRQRQQEEVIGISGVNPAHMIIGYNDFRTIDFKDDTGVGTQGPIQGLLAKVIDFFKRPWQREREREDVFEADEPAGTNGAWMGFSITDNGGKSWYSGLHPGRYVPLPPPSFPPFPGDESYKLDNFDSASDPVVGATHNEFFFGGIAFNAPLPAGDGKGIGFVSRFTDYNDTETGQNIRFDGTRVLLKSDDFVTTPGSVPKFFVDKPSVAAAPGAPGGKAYVYAAFVVFDQSDPAKLSSKILFFRSTNSGETWSAPITVSQPLSRNQSPWILVDPNNPLNVYIGWRVFANPLFPNLTNAIVGRRSTNGGANFTPSVPFPVALLLKPFDQPQGNISGPNPTFPSPRSAAYPTAAIDGNGAIHVLVQEYVYPANYAVTALRGLPLIPGTANSVGVPRITSSSSYNQGTTWTIRKAIDLGNGAGTQFMPMVTAVGEPGNSCAGSTGPRSRVIAMFYDARANGVGVLPGGTGILAGGDKQFDVRVAQASACSTNGLSFLSSELVSQYTRSSQPPFDIVKIKDYPQYSAVNRGYTMNCTGNCSFAGDYIHQSPRNPYIKTASGAWKLTTATMDATDRAKLPAPVVQLVWADTRDALLPTIGAIRTAPVGLSFIDSLPWQEYAAPATGFLSCINPGARDQNVYTAEYTPGGLYASAPVTFKTSNIPRSYPLYIENRTGQLRYYRVTINESAVASFDYKTFAQPAAPYALSTALVIAAVSSVTGTVVVRPGNIVPISITVLETDSSGGNLPAPAKTTVTLNVGGADDGSSTETYLPVINPFVTETKPFFHLGVNRTAGQSLFVPKNGAFPNPTPLAPNPLAPNPLAPNPLAPNPLAPNPLAPNPLAPNPLAPNPLAPNPLAPNPFPNDVTVYDVTDISYVVTNEGEQTAALKVLANAPNDGKHVYLMFINRAVPTPAFSYENGLCKAVDNWQGVPISTFVTPLAPNPLAPNPLAPNPLAPNPLAPNPLAPNYPPDVSNATLYVTPASPEQSSALLAKPGNDSERLARRDGNSRIRSVSLTPPGPAGAYLAPRPKDFGVITIRDILIDPTGTALTKASVNFKVKAEIPNHNGQTFEAAANETGTQVPDHLAFNPQPASSTASGATMAQFKVEIQDTFNALVSTAPSQLVTLALGGTFCSGAAISGNTATTSGGVATFNNVVITTPQTCTGVRLVASATSLKPGTSNAFNVTVPAFQCYQDLPNPVLTFTGTENYSTEAGAFTRFNLSVSNRASFPDALFAAAPDLPPCGLNTSASRTWVNILDPDDEQIYGFCALSASSQLDQIWFSVPAGTAPPNPVHITLEDRRCEQTYTSNAVSVVPAAGVLFAATDHEEFEDTSPSELAVINVSGSSINSIDVVDIAVPFNGFANVGGFLVGGNPETEDFVKLDFAGNLISSGTLTGAQPVGCCHEDWAYDGTTLYRAHYDGTGGEIDKINPSTGEVLQRFFTPYDSSAPSEPVGITFVGSQVWVSRWSFSEVGIWDPVANTFTHKFYVPEFAGGLAYDPGHGVMWVGQRGGCVVPYDLNGNILGYEDSNCEGGAGIQPFGPIEETIDGLEFVAPPPVITFQSPSIGEGTHLDIDPYASLGVTFSAEYGGFEDEIVGLVKNRGSSTSACVTPESSGQQLLGTGRSGLPNSVGFGTFKIRASMPGGISGPVTISVDVQTLSDTTARLRLFGWEGELLATGTGVPPPTGICPDNSGPTNRGRVTLSATALSGTVVYAIIDETVGGRVLLIDNFKIQ